MKTKKKDEESLSTAIRVDRLVKGLVEFSVIGDRPIILNKLSRKTQHELLMPGNRNAAERKSSLKHNPYEEFRASAHTQSDENYGPYLAMPSAAFHGAMSSVAIDLPGEAKKAQIARLTFVIGKQPDYVGIYGIPMLYMAMVRSADMNHTPDVRTRVIIPRWCATFRVEYVKPMLNEAMVANLLDNSGMIRGVGDGRPEKGKLNFGQFHICAADDKKDFAQIVKEGTRQAQLKAMEEAAPYDDETRELLAWFDSELERRHKATASAPVKPNGAAVTEATQ